MVEERDSTARIVLDEIKRNVPGKEALTQLVETTEGWVLTLEPCRRDASALELRVAKGAWICDVAAGNEAQWSDMDCTPARIVEIVDAIRDGKLEETFWDLGKIRLQSRARLTLKSETLFTRRLHPLFFLRGMFVREPTSRMVYAPYREHEQPSRG